jgi:hypothetical protein
MVDVLFIQEYRRLKPVEKGNKVERREMEGMNQFGLQHIYT